MKAEGNPIMRHDLEWLAPAPLWQPALDEGSGRGRFRQPAVLRFDSDGFMDELQGLLADDPETLRDRVAKPETWERPASGWAEAGDPSLGRPLKLFQPTHGRFYLAAAELVCRRAGLPQRKVDAAGGERASLLLRRLVPRAGAVFDPDDPATYTEHAWIGDRSAGRWQGLEAPAGAPPEGEERLAMFPLPFTHEERPRRLWAAMLPAAGRELYEGAASAATPAPAPPPPAGDPLAVLADPRKAAWAAGAGASLAELAKSPSEPDLTAEVARELLAFAMLDLADLLYDELPELWAAIDGGGAAAAALLPAAERAVYDRLGTALPAGGGTWRQALVRAREQRQVLLGEADPAPGTVPPVPAGYSVAEVRSAASGLIHGGHFQSELFTALGPAPAAGEEVTGAAATAPTAAARAAASAAASAAGDGAFYHVRCLYERPQCKPYHDPLVGPASRPFRLAAFFDPEAPARPLTIRMPLDTSIKGLKKFPKGVSMLLSNKLRQQVERVQSASLEDIDKGDIAGSEPGWELGMICSLSIPIITICALIVLMIFVQLLNIVFWWLPFFKICLPIPVKAE